jgi:cytochrome b
MSNAVNVWDLPSRLCHGLLAASVLGCYGTAEWGWLSLRWHFYFGYTAIVLVLFRLLWGIWGSEHARFRTFVRGPRAVFAYLRSMLSPGSGESVGHSALGGWAVIALLFATLAQGLSGLFNSDDIEWFGPLNEIAPAEWVDTFADFHESFYNVLLLLIGLHVIAALLYLLLKKQNLIWPMVTGRKTSVQAADAVQKPLWLAALTLALSGALLWIAIEAFKYFASGQS